jgi:WD40 repeat protein
VAGKRSNHDSVGRFAFSPDRGRILTGGLGGAVRLWEVASGKELATMVSFKDSGWAVLDSSGLYDASDPDNALGLHFLAGLDIIQLGQLKQRFYTPGLLARIWRNEQVPAIDGLKRVKLVPAVEVYALAEESTFV